MFGILTASFWQVGFWWVIGIGMVGGVMCVLKKKKLFLVGLFLVAFLIGIFRFQVFQYDREDSNLTALLNTSISGTGVVIAEPDRRDNSLRLTLQTKYKNNILAVTGAYADIKYGDEVTFKGLLVKPQNFNTDTGRIFDYVHFLQKDNIFFEINLPKLTVVRHDRGDWLQSKLLSIKYAFLEKLAVVIAEPELSLLGGLFLGTKQSLGTKLLSEFQRAGVIHMVVISGYNITIVAEAMGGLLSFFSLSFRLFFSGVGVILFVLMTGASAASVRAAIMAIVALFGRLVGRKYDVTRALLFAAFLMVLYNPLTLAFDPSFQLSFLATLALLVVSPVLEPYFRSWPNMFGLRETLVATLSTQLFLLPFLLYLTGIFSVVSLPVNLIVLFPVPFTMLMGFISGVLAFISVPLALPFAFITNAILAYILYIVETAANLWFAAVSFGYFPLWLMLAFYLFYIILLWKLHHKERTLLPEVSDSLISSQNDLPPLSS